MSVDYLDKTGLSYFWGKLKDWAINLFAADSDVVHKTGNETISSNKTFYNSTIILDGTNDYKLNMTRLDVNKGTNPSTGKYGGLCAFEKSGSYVANRLSALNLSIDTSGNTYSTLSAYKFVTGTAVAAEFMCVCTPSGVYSQRSNTIRPHTNNTYSLGDGTYRYTALYAVDGSIQTSDARFKHDIDYIPDAVLDAWELVEWKQYRMLSSVQKKGRDSARIHAGAVAQQIRDAFSGAGLDAASYGFFCHDEWEETQEVRGGDGQVLVPYNPAGDSYSLRYDEALCMEAAYMRRENARLKKRVAGLEERLAALELKVS